MRKMFFVVAAVVLTSTALPSLAITGKVIDARGRPVAGAEVYRNVARVPEMKTFKTDDKGAVTVDYPGSGRQEREPSIVITAQDKDGKALANGSVSFPWGGSMGSEAKALRTDKNGRFPLTSPRPNPDKFIGIRVRDSSNKPVPNASLKASDGTGRNMGPAITMDDKGEMNYRDRMPRAEANAGVLVSAQGYAYASAELKPGAKTLVVRLRPEQRVTGKIKSETGAPVQGSRIAVENISMQTANRQYFRIGGWSVHRSFLYETYSGKDGKFVLHHIPSRGDFSRGNISLQITGKGRADINKNYDFGQLLKSVAITHPRGCTIQGIVYLPGKTGPAPPNTQLMIEVSQGNSSRSQSVGLDKGGRFKMSGLAPGTASVRLGSQRYERDSEGRPIVKPNEWILPATNNIKLNPAKATNLVLVGVKGALVEGVVRDKTSGKPIENARVLVQDPGRMRDYYSDDTITDKNGAFSTRVVPGQVNVSVQSIESQGREHVYFEDEERTIVTFEAIDGQDKKDVVLEVDPSESRSMAYDMREKKIPADFQLKPGSYSLTWDPNLTMTESQWIGGEFRDKTAKQLMAKLPQLKSKKPQFYAVRLDGTDNSGLLCIVMDEAKGPGKGYDRAYVDANRNFDLSDDTPVAVPPGQYMRNTQWVTVQAHQGPAGAERASNPIQARLQVYGGNGQDARLQRKGAWVGEVDTASGKAKFALADTNCNGIYGERTKIDDKLNSDYSARGDCAFVDSVGMGKVVLYEYGPGALKLSDAIMLNKHWYTIDASPVGDKVAIADYGGPMGKLMVRASDIGGMKGSAKTIMVRGKTGEYNFEDTAGQPISLPAGKYRVTNCDIDLAANGKKMLSLGCSLDSLAQVESDKQSDLVVGGKLSMTINPEQKRMLLVPGQSADVNWVIKIGKNATVSSIGNRDKPPTVKFYNKAGKLTKTTTAGFT